jgi:release factor glutamine methyltransferase
MERLTVLDVLQRTEGFLRDRGSMSARLDAELLMGDALGLDRVGVYLAYDRPLDEDETTHMRGLVRERGRGLPVAYLLGGMEFYGLELHVDSRVLVPRPETECLVDRCLELIADVPGQAADVGTGSGAIACALAHERPQLTVLATEIEPGAVEVARANVERLVPGRVNVVQADLLGPAEPGSLDLIASNPPYVAEGDPALHPHVAAHEPAVALYASEQGLGIYRRLMPEAFHALRPGGWLVLEIGHGQAGPVGELVTKAGFVPTDVKADLSGIPRVIAAQRPPEAAC